METRIITQKDECNVTISEESYETICWGCGLRLSLPSYTPIFKCGWCGAITNNMLKQHKSYWFDRYSAIRDRFFVITVVVLILSIICGGIWAVYPVVFNDVGFTSIIHCILTILFATGTLVNYFLAAFRPAGRPPNVPWGNHNVVGKGGLNEYSFCQFCSKPKSKQTHHCSSCKCCVLDMDHHCPFIGNCVGAENHHHFITFLFFALVSNIYVFVMSLYSLLWIWPSLLDGPNAVTVPIRSWIGTNTVKRIIYGLMNSPILMSARAVALLYLTMASLSVAIGIGVLLYQQVHLLYNGHTYIDSLKGETSEGLHSSTGWANFLRIFKSGHSIYWFLPKKIK